MQPIRASLGLPPDVAEKNLKQCRVRLQAIDVNGAKELGAALTKLGVRVVKGAADLTIVLVNDYLEGQADRNKPAASPIGRPGYWCSRPAFSRLWDRCSSPVKAPVGPVSPTACSATARSRRCWIGGKHAASRLPL